MEKFQCKHDTLRYPTKIRECKSPSITTKIIQDELEAEHILCPYCQRTVNNGVKCKGICVADSNY
mgnify:CR=1 FL=1